MGRRTGGVVLAAVLAVPAMLLGSAEQASAANGGTVTWRNHKNDFFLSAHGGRVWVEDRADGEPGSRFVLELPAEEAGVG